MSKCDCEINLQKEQGGRNFPENDKQINVQHREDTLQAFEDEGPCSRFKQLLW